MSFLKIDACAVSGARIMITSAHWAASATGTAARPAASALALAGLPARTPTFTVTPLSFKLSACACPCEP